MTTEEIMNIYSILQLCGGLAFFLFGMHVMSGSLEKLAGGNLQKILKGLTSNPAKSLFFGAVITIAIQSSSALTVMLVGLVNSGIMELGQTVGVIMGSNIGTTLTAWILSLSGIQSESIFISLLKPENFSPIVALIGVIMIMGAKSEKKKDAGVIMAGFAVLMYGMQLMSGAVSPLADMPEFTSILTTFNNPLIGVLTGAVFTGVIQSSAASVGVLQALAMTGAISYGMAIPIIMGQNIGTCVTALLSSIGVSKNAKRVSVIHVSFNVFGTIIGLIIYYILRYGAGLSIFDGSISAFAIAGFHSVFNVATTIILIPFGKYLVKIAQTVIPIHDEKSNGTFLDERLLLSPGLAIKECLEKTSDMAELAKKSFKASLDLFDTYSDTQFEEITAMEEQLDFMEDQLDTYLIHLSGKDTSETGSNEISKMLHAINDFERIGDHAINLAKLAKQADENNYEISKSAKSEISVLNNALKEILDLTVNSFNTNDENIAFKVEPLEQVIDDLTKEIRNHHIARLQKGKCDSRLGVFLTDYITNCERASDHCSNIAVCLIQTKNSSFETHDYLNELKTGHEPAFVGEFTMFHDKYTLDNISDNDSDKSAKKDTSRKNETKKDVTKKKDKDHKDKDKNKKSK